MSTSDEKSIAEVLILLATSKDEEEKERGKQMLTEVKELDTNLSNKKNCVHDASSSLLEPNLLTKVDLSDAGKPEVPEKVYYKCNFCTLKFSTSKALGSHQKLHKEERALAKRRDELHVESFNRHPSYPFYSHPRIYNGPIHEPSLGVRANSMIQKPWFSNYTLGKVPYNATAYNGRGVFPDYTLGKSTGFPNAQVAYNATAYGGLGVTSGEGFQGQPSCSRFEYGVHKPIPLQANGDIQLPHPEVELHDSEDDNPLGLDLDLKL